jgi:flagellar FliJ protein
MVRFKFRLESVQNLRRHVEQEQRDALARERQKLYELQDELKRLGGEFRYWSREYIKSAQAGMSPPEAIRINAYIWELSRLIESSEKMAAEQNTAVEKARLELIEKMTERKTLDRLYEKQFSSYTENEQKKEEHEVEELSMGRLYIGQ